MAWTVRVPIQIELDRGPREREDRRKRDRLTEEMRRFKELADKALTRRNRQLLAEERRRERLVETAQAFAPAVPSEPGQYGPAYPGRPAEGRRVGREFAEAIERGADPEKLRRIDQVLKEEGVSNEEFAAAWGPQRDLLSPEQRQKTRVAIERLVGLRERPPEPAPPDVPADSVQEEALRRFLADPEVQRLQALLEDPSLTENERAFIEQISLKNKLLEKRGEVAEELQPGVGVAGAARAVVGGVGKAALQTWEQARRLEEPIAEPIAGALRLGVEQTGLPVIGPAGGRPQPGRATELVEERGLRAGLREAGAEAPLLTEFTRLTNWVPIPVVDAAVARVLGIAGKQAMRIPAFRGLIAKAERLVFTEADEATRIGLSRFIDDSQEALRTAELRGGAEVPPQEPLGLPEPRVSGREEGRFPGMERLPREMEPVLGEMEQAQRAIPQWERDLVGEELDRVTIPTSRQVEASSKLVPPEVRAERAAPPPDVRVPMEDWATVETRIGTRFQQNWWTKIDDVIGPPMGRNRQLERDVRNTMIVKDEFIRSQAGRMRVGVLDWIGRNRRVLGLKTQGARRGYAEAIQVRPGAKIQRNLVQHLDHITEHPEKYIISDEQLRALTERQDIFENVLRAEQRHGVNVDELADAYAPRVITKTPKEQRPEVALTNVTTRYFKTRPWYTKARAIPDIEQLWAAGYRTLDPLSAMELRVATGAETIANVQALNRIKGMGYRPLERVRPQLAEELGEATKAHQAARKQARKTGSTADKATALEKEVRLDQATRDMRAEARLLVERQEPKVLGRIVPPDVRNELNRYLATVPEGGVDEFLRLARASLVTTDYGSPLLQNWYTFWRDNPTWLKSFVHGVSAVADNPHAFIIDHLDAIERGIRYGSIRAPEEFLLMRGGRLSREVGKLPVIRESQRVFEWNIFTAQTYRWEAVEGTAKNADELFELASVLRKQSGSNFMPGLTARQARWLTRTWFAPQFTTALQASLVDPLVKTGPARREALKTLAMAFGGAAVVTVAVNQRLNGELPNMTDPDEAGFWAIRMPDAVGGGYVYPFGPFQPAIVALTRSGRAATALARGETPSVRDMQAWPRFASNKASIAVRLMMRVGEAMGLPIETLRGPSFQEPEVIRDRENILQALQRELGGYAPIGAAQAYRGISEGAPIAALEFGGGRVTVETAWQEMQRRRQEIMDERDITGTFEELRVNRPHIADEIDRDPRIVEAQRILGERPPRTREGEGFQAEKALVTRFKADQQGDDDNLEAFFLSGGQTEFTPQRYGELARDRAKTLHDKREQLREDYDLEFAERIPDPGTVGDALEAYWAVDIDKFTDPLTREVDWGPFNDAQERALSGLSGEQREGAMSVIRKNQTDIQRAFKELRDEPDMDAYWDIPSEDRAARDRFRQTHPRVDAILYVTGTTTKLMGGRGLTEANALIRRLFGSRASIPTGTIRERRGGDGLMPSRRDLLPTGGDGLMPSRRDLLP